jgi:chromosome segregation ATPase
MDAKSAMSERKEPDLDLSGLEGQVEPQPPERPAQPPASQKSAAPRGSGGSILLTLILLLMVAGGGVLAYWVTGLQQTIAAQTQQLDTLNTRLGEMEQQLATTSDSASEAGQTLTSRMARLEKQAGEKYAHFDSEIAKLWTVSYQRNKPQLESLKASFEARAKELQAIDERLVSAGKQLAAVEGQVDELTQRVVAINQLEKEVKALTTALKDQGKRLSDLGAELNFALSLEKDERLAGDRALADRVDKLADQGDRSAAQNQRLQAIERSIEAIDGSRRQFSQRLLQLQERLDRLQNALNG